MTADEIIEKLAALENPENIAGMARFGIVAKIVDNVYFSLPRLTRWAGSRASRRRRA